MPRKRLLPRTVRPRSPPLAHRHHPLAHDHTFLANFRYFALTEAYTLAALDALHAHILSHDFASALHLLSLLLRARTPPPFLSVWQAGVAILRGLLLSDLDTQSAPPAFSQGGTGTGTGTVTHMSVVRLLMTMLAMDDDSAAVYRPHLAVELALTLICAGQDAQAYTHLDPLASQFPYADDLHVVGVLGMVCVALIERSMPAESLHDDSDNDNEDDEHDRPRSRSRASPAPPPAAGPYLTSARAAFDRLLAVHPATPTYLEYHLRYLRLSGMERQIPGVIQRVLGALAQVGAEPGSVDAAELRRRRDHVWAVAGVYGVTRRVPVHYTKRRSMSSSPQQAEEPSTTAHVLDDPTLTARWRSSTLPTSSKPFSSLFAQFDYPVHSPALWRQLVRYLHNTTPTSRIAVLFQGRKEWWFALHLASHAHDPVDVLVYKLAVMRMVAPETVEASKDAVWMARRRGGAAVDERDERRAVREALSGFRIRVEDVYLDAMEDEEEESSGNGQGSDDDEGQEASNSEDNDDDDDDDNDDQEMADE